MRSSSGSPRSRPTIPCSPLALPARAVPRGSCSIARPGCRPSSRLAQTARDVPVMVAVTERATPSRREQLVELGCEVVAFPGRGRVPIAPLLDELGRRGMTNVLVEGGGQVLGSFLDEGQVDAVDVFIAPILEGGDHARTAVRGKGMACTDARRSPVATTSRFPRSAATYASAAGCPSPGALARDCSTDE